MNYTDIKHDGWIAALPESWRPFAILMRLDRPIGWWLLLLPGWWGILLGANGLLSYENGHVNWHFSAADIRLLILFLIGAICMRGAGCIINDIIDRNLDKKVERTHTRPIASGQISLFHAGALLFMLIFIGFVILLQTSLVAILLGFLAVPLIIAYPFMKRITWWPQAFLGITFNMSALIGWAAATHRLDFEAFCLYAAGIVWTMGYDTVYAHQDIEDDAIVGIKSTARLFQNHSHLWVCFFYLLTIIFLIGALWLAGAGIISYALLILPALHFIKQISLWRLYDPNSALEIFKSNRTLGFLILPSLALIDISLADISPEIYEQLRNIISFTR